MSQATGSASRKGGKEGILHICTKACIFVRSPWLAISVCQSVCVYVFQAMCMCNIIIWVVKFQREGYEIRKTFCQKINTILTETCYY